MKLIVYFLFFLSVTLNAQNLTQLSNSIKQLDNSLVKKDIAALNLVLHEKVSVTHSNGFTEDKLKMVENTTSSFIKYNKIEQLKETEYLKLNDESYIAYRFVNVQGIYDVYDFEVNLRLMEVWVWEDSRWQLIGRQSLELEND